MSTRGSGRLKSFSAWLALFTAAGMTLALGGTLFSPSAVQYGGLASEVVWAPSPRVFRSLLLRHWTSGLDWLWLQAILDPSIERLGRDVRPGVFYRFDLSQRLDPANLALALAAGDVLAIIRDDAIGAKVIVERAEAFRIKELPAMGPEFAEAHWSAPWRLPLFLGYLYLYELDDLASAAVAFQNASEIQGSPDYLRGMAARLKRPGGVYEVGLRLLRYMEVTAPDERSKESILSRQKDLFLSQFLYQENLKFREFINAHERSTRVLSHPEILRLHDRFLKEGGGSREDPWGAPLVVEPGGRISSPTPRRKVFGLE